MHSRFDRLTSVTAIVLALATSVMFLPVSFAASSGSVSVSSGPQQTGAILTTAGNRQVNLNGSPAVSGATVMTGASIETPDQVGASMTIPGHFSLDISVNTNVRVDFTTNGIKVNLIKGCVVLHIVKGTTGEITTSKGVIASADGSKDARLDVCDPSIATAPAAAAGGLSTGAKIAIVAAVAGAVAIIPLVGGGRNPSPGAP
jgi:hypothetical protein